MVDYLYIMHNTQTNLYKIGISINCVHKRARQLSTSSGCDINLIMYCELNDIDIRAKEFEERLHSQFKDKRCSGEWFDLDVKDLCKIYDAIIKEDCLDFSIQDDKLEEEYNKWWTTENRR